MIILLILLFIAVALGYILYSKMQQTTVPSVTVNQNPLVKLLDLNTTTVAERQRAYHHGFRQQLQYDELQRRAEASGDIATLEAIRLGTYEGPLPDLKDDEPTSYVAPKLNLELTQSDVAVHQLQYFCIKDKGYHVSVWPKNHDQFDILEFNIAGMSHRDNIDDYIGEFIGTLEAEPSNPYDSNAIKVLAADGHHVGYVPAAMTAEVRKEADLPCPCYCYIGNNDGIYFSDCYIIRK